MLLILNVEYLYCVGYRLARSIFLSIVVISEWAFCTIQTLGGGMDSSSWANAEWLQYVLLNCKHDQHWRENLRRRGLSVWKSWLRDALDSPEFDILSIEPYSYNVSMENQAMLISIWDLAIFSQNDSPLLAFRMTDEYASKNANNAEDIGYSSKMPYRFEISSTDML